MIRRDLHPICDNCWDKIVGVERWKVRDLHHFFTYNKNPECCWCGFPSHGQFWKANRLDVPCRGMFNFHATNQQIIDLDDMRVKYADDNEVKELVSMAKAFQAELAELQGNVVVDLRPRPSRERLKK